MARPNKLAVAYPDIVTYFERSEERVFTAHRLGNFIDDQREEWKIGKHRKLTDIINFLIEKGNLQTHRFRQGENNQVELYSWETQDEFTIISGLKNNAYFAFYSALFIHQLTLQIPKTFYLNFEHSSEQLVSGKPLTQEAIDKAFSKFQRKSLLTYSWKGNKIVITNGKKTGLLGVNKQISDEQSFSYTDLERTLIDIAVRPAYSGGVFEVLEAYRRAKEKLNIEKLAHYLEELDYMYPYEQVVGFYLQQAGYAENQYKVFRKKQEWKFYLTYNLRNPLFSEEWKLYHPKGF